MPPGGRKNAKLTWPEAEISPGYELFALLRQKSPELEAGAVMTIDLPESRLRLLPLKDE